MTITANLQPSAFLPPYSPYNQPDQPTDDKNIHTSSINRKKRGAATSAALWPQGSTIKISFIGMNKEQEKLTKENINKWAPHVNLKFEFTDKPDGDIRISANTNSGGWSKVGTDAKSVPAEEATMGIGFGLPFRVAITIQHEFGHALGLQHEHQHPQNTIKFNKQAIYNYQQSVGASKEGTDHNFFNTLDPEKTIQSPYDQKSIMHYSFWKWMISEGDEIPQNHELSEGDKKFASSLYPPKVEEPQPSFKPKVSNHPLQNPSTL